MKNKLFNILAVCLCLLLITACGGSGSTSGNAQAANAAPNAVNDSFTLTANSLLDVLANDTDPDGDRLTVSSVTQPANGSVSIQDNQIEVLIDAGFSGTVDFTYTVQDGRGGSDTALVVLDIQADNQAPQAVTDNVTNLQNAVTLILPLANDSDPNNDPLSIVSVSSPTNGSAEVINQNQIRYIPLNGFIGQESFTYTVSDGDLESEGIINIVLTLPDNGANRLPLAVNDSFVVQINQTTNLDVLANDTDPENDNLSLVDVVAPSNGVATIVNNQIEYTPNLNYLGEDSFIYIVTDGNQETAAVVTLDVRTQAINNTPTARDDSAFARQGQTVTISPFLNDLDMDGDALVLNEIGAALNGSYIVDNNQTPDDFRDDRIIYTPQASFVGTEILVYTISDGIAEDRAAININVTNEQTATQLLRGSIHKGGVAGALITLYPATRSGEADINNPIAAATSERDGLWSVRIPTDADNVLVVAQGGTFIDESDPDANILEKRIIDLGSDTILESYRFIGQSNIAISPYTSAYIRKARYEASNNTNSFWATVRNNRNIAIQAMGFNPFATIPTEPLIPSPNASTVSVQYALDLGGFANAMNANAIELDLATPTPELIDVLIDDLADCELDAQFFGNALALVDVTNINNEIRRFKNNNIDVYPNTDAAIDVSLCQQDGSSNDTTVPTLSLIGEDPLVLQVGDQYIEPGVLATDETDGDLQSSVIIDGVVDTSSPSTYILNYSVSDLSGNTSSVSRTVIVEDNEIPVITLLGSSVVLLEAGTVYQDAGATAFDPEEGDLTSRLIIANPVNTDVPGFYTITYDVTDSSGNSALQVSRSIEVSDSTPPAIVLSGSNPQAIEAGSTYIELGAMAQDIVDGDVSSALLIDSSAVDTSMTGNYQVIYTVTDSSGNTASSVRNVIVQDSTLPIITLLGNNPETVEAGSVYVDAGVTASDTVDGDLTSEIQVQNSVDTSVLGTYSVIYTVSDSEGNTSTVTRIVDVVDTSPPVITLLGASPQILEAGSSYTELGATAIDSQDGNLTSSILIDASTVNIMQPGTYSVSYDVVDTAGNAAAAVIRNVIVQDTQSPSLTLVGTNPQVIEAGNTYLELGATASDSLDGDLSSEILIDASSVNTNVPGDYLVTYNVMDSAGNTAPELIRTVQVRDTTVPVISLLGSNPVSLLVNEAYTEFGATAFDSLDGDISSRVIIDNSALDTSIPGNYSVTYNVRDAAGNDAIEVTRIVSVVDTTAPVINLLGANPQNVELGDVYIEQGATATDNVDGDITSDLVIDSSSVDTSNLGIYIVTYNVTDNSGQAALEVIRTVEVVDTTLPQITLLGNDPETVEAGTPYTDPGATVNDLGDPTVTVSNDAATVVNSSVVGSYLVTFTATDASGNTAFETRTVNVIDTTAPIISLVGSNPQVIEAGNAYSELGANATDSVEGDLSTSILIDSTTVNVNLPGTYTVTYNVSDSAGNAATEVIRTVTVQDTTAPLILLTGANPQIIEAGDAYSELGATATDTLDGDLTASLVIDNTSVDTNVPGDYVVSYNVSDAAGNPAVEVTRTVTVQDTTLPVITLVGADPQLIYQGTAYTELNAIATDNIDGDISAQIIIDASSVDTSTVGTYQVTYNVADSSLNAAVEVTRTVSVISPSISIANASLIESNVATSLMAFTITLDQVSTSDVSVTYATSNGSATVLDNDYVATTGSVQIDAGNTTALIEVEINGDSIVETDESFSLNLSAPVNAILATSSAIGTIVNDDQSVVSIAAATITEQDTGSVDLAFTVSLDQVSTEEITVVATTSDGTATLADNDYVATTVTAVIAAGDMATTVTVPINGDTFLEDDENFMVSLSSPTNASLGVSNVMGTIQNNDSLIVTISDATTLEGNTGDPVAMVLNFAVTNNNKSSNDVTIDYLLAGTVFLDSGDNDFVTPSDPLVATNTYQTTISSGLLTSEINITIFGDDIVEADETVTLALTEAVSGTALDNAVGTIVNDDVAEVSISTVSGSASENTPTENLEYLITIDNPAAIATTVFYSISGAGINLPNDDVNELVVTSGQVLIPALQTSVTLELEVLDDNLLEGPETLTISLDGTNNDVVLSATNTATGLITDNDTAALSIADAGTVAEGNTTDPVTDIRQLDFVLSFDNPVSSNTTVTYQLEGSATSGDDYDTPAILEAVIAASPDGISNPTETISIFIRKDDVTEADETVNIRLLTSSNGSIIDNFATGVIENDDPPNVTLVTDDVVFLLAGSTYVDPATAEDSGGASLPITYSGDVATLGTAQTINVPATTGGPFTRIYDVAAGPSPPLERTIYIVDSLAQADTDGDGVSDLIENAVGSDTTITNETLFVDPAATGDGTEWSNALPQLPTTYTAGASVAETSYVMIAENSLLTDGINLNSSNAPCDNLAFIGSLQAVTSPVEAPAQVVLTNRDNPSTDVTVMNTENTVVSACQSVYFGNISFTNGTGNSLTDTGGGIDVSNGAVVTIENVDVKRNTALQGGGGVAVRGTGTSLDIKGSRIVNNRLLTSVGSRYGGGLYIEGEVIVSIDESSTYTDGRLEPTAISANRVEGASVQGGGIGIFGDANVDIRHAVISGNHSSSDGGGIYIDTTTTDQNIKIVNNLILANAADGSGGAIGVNRAAEHRINNNTIMYNDAGFAGSAYSSTNSSIQYFNNIAKDNESRSGIEDMNFAATSGLCSNNWANQGPYLICADTDNRDATILSVNFSIISEIGFYLRYATGLTPPIDTATLAPLPGVTNADKLTQSGVEGRTTDSTNNNVPDSILLDMGYHYPLNDENRNADQILLLTPTLETNSNDKIRVRPFVSGSPLGPKQSLYYRIPASPADFIDDSPSDVEVLVNPFLNDGMGTNYLYGQFTDLGDGTYTLDVQTLGSGDVEIEVLSNPDASPLPIIFSATIPICTTGVDCP